MTVQYVKAFALSVASGLGGAALTAVSLTSQLVGRVDALELGQQRIEAKLDHIVSRGLIAESVAPVTQPVCLVVR